MAKAAEIVKATLDKTKNVSGASIRTPMGEPEVQYQPDLELFHLMQVDPQSALNFFQLQNEQGINTNLTLMEDGVERPVMIKAISDEHEKAEDAQTLSELRKKRLPLANGGVATLGELGRFKIGQSVGSIQKHNRQRKLDISFSLPPLYYKKGMDKEHQLFLRNIQENLGKLRLPEGISIQMSGTLEGVNQQKASWKKLLKLAVISVYLVMAFFFESIWLPFVVFWTIPLALIGGIWGTIVLKTPLDEVALLGAIALAGLVVNNGILLVERTRQLEVERKFRRHRAILSSVNYRFRPILMTTLTTVLPIVPILFMDQTAHQARSLAAVMIGGMTVSCLGSLILIPGFYNVTAIFMEYTHRFLRELARRFSRMKLPLLRVRDNSETPLVPCGRNPLCRGCA